MKAVVRTHHGPPSGLRVEEQDTPTPGDDDVLVEVRAVSLNASGFLTERPLYARIYGLRRPRIRVFGFDVAGRVEAVGRKVAHLKPGDEVFGDIFEHWGWLAEYAAAPETQWLAKPASMTFEQAAASARRPRRSGTWGRDAPAGRWSSRCEARSILALVVAKYQQNTII